MYIFYEHHKDAFGKIVLTEMRLSSYNPHLAINFRSQLEVTIFELCKPILKFPPVAFRSYEDATKIWSYFGETPYGELVLQKIQEVTKALGGVTAIAVEDLLSSAQAGQIRSAKKQSVRPEDFFYNTTAPSSTSNMTKDSILPKLASLLQVEEKTLSTIVNGELKKLYRQAALRLHPDRNQGDGSKMSELNMLWRIYNG